MPNNHSTREELLKYARTPYGVIFLASSLIKNPNQDIVFGVEGGDQLTISSHEAKKILETFQDNNFTDAKKIKDFSNPQELRILYLNVMDVIRSTQESTLPDPETRASLLRAYREQLTTIDSGQEGINFPSLNAQIRSAQAYHFAKTILNNQINQSIDQVINNSNTTQEARNYLSLNKNNLTASLFQHLAQMPESSPQDIQIAITQKILSLPQTNSYWAQAEIKLFTPEGNQLHSIATKISSFLADTDFQPHHLETLKQQEKRILASYPPSPTSSKQALLEQIKTWRSKLPEAAQQQTAGLEQELIKNINRQTAIYQEKAKPWTKFTKPDKTLFILSQATLDTLKTYNLSPADANQLKEGILQDTEAMQYLIHTQQSLPSKKPTLLPRPLSTLSFIAAKTGIDPQIITAFGSGGTQQQLIEHLQSQGYTLEDIQSQLQSLTSFLAKNQGLLGGIHRLNLKRLNLVGRIKSTIAKTISRVANAALRIPPIKLTIRASKTIQSVVFAIGYRINPKNWRAVRFLANKFNNLKSTIIVGYSNFLSRHNKLAFLVSKNARFKWLQGKIGNIITNRNLHPSFRKLAIMFKNGNYTLDGLKSEFKSHIRLKIGNWFLKKAALVGAGKLSGQLLGWIGSSLITGTLTGGIGFFVQAGLFLWRKRRDIRDALGNMNLIVVKGLQSLIGLLGILKAIAINIVGAALGVIGGLILFGTTILGLPVLISLAVYALAGVAVAYLFTHISQIVAWIGAAVQSTITAVAGAVSTFVSSLLQSALAVGSIAATSIATGLGVAVVGTYLTTSAIITSQIPTSVKPGLEDTSGSKYIQITKEADTLSHTPNSQLPKTVIYKVTIQAIQETLTNIHINDTLIQLTDGSSGIEENSINSETENVNTLAPGESFEFTYEVDFSPSFADSYLTNTVKVTAQSSQGEEFKAVSLNIAIGTPPVLPAAAFAIRLAQAITSCYGDVVSLADGGQCLEDRGDPQISAVIQTLRNSALGNTFLQCVGFVRAVEEGTGSSLGGAIGIAADWIDNPPAGYVYLANDGTTTPIPGDLFLMDLNEVLGTGHVGVVTGVAGVIISVADANSNGTGGTRSSGAIPLNRIAGFLRRN